MLDLVLVAFIGLIAALGLKRPFVWVLLYIYVDIVIPQKIGWGFINALPLSLMVFVLAFGGWLVLDGKAGSKVTIRQFLIVALLAWCGMTTITAQFQDSAWDKWDWVWKSLVFAAFLPLTLRTKLRLEAAVLVIVLSIGAIVISGGLKTALGGGGYGTLTMLVDDNAGIYEGSIISTAAIAVIPLVLWCAKFGTIFKPEWRVTAFAAALIFACLLIPVGTSARTGLVCIGVLGLLLMRTAQHRFAYGAAAAAALVVAMPFLPASFTDRMGTIIGYQGDQSASTRLAVWQWTMDYAKDHPLGGGFDAYRANSFTYQTRNVSGEGGNVLVEFSEVTEEARAYHSSYFELLGEQGYPGLAMWLLLQAMGVWQMEQIRRRFTRKGEPPTWQAGLANALQQAQLVYLVGAAFVGIAFQPFIFLLVGLQISLASLARRMPLAQEVAAKPWLKGQTADGVAQT